jgi:hypothetical protein
LGGGGGGGAIDGGHPSRVLGGLTVLDGGGPGAR